MLCRLLLALTIYSLTIYSSAIPLFTSPDCRVADFRLNQQQARSTQAFLRGFYSIMHPGWVRMFNERELQMLISGSAAEGGLDLAVSGGTAGPAWHCVLGHCMCSGRCPCRLHHARVACRKACCCQRRAYIFTRSQIMYTSVPASCSRFPAQSCALPPAPHPHVPLPAFVP